MTCWKDRLVVIEAKNVLNSILKQQQVNEPEISEFFKFLSGAVKLYPDALELVIQRIIEEWHIKNHSLLFKSTVSFLARLKRTLRRQEFKNQISKLWPLVFGFPEQDRLKLFLVREYRKELPFNWLLEYVMLDETEFFYSVDLNAQELDRAALAVIDVLMELLERGKGSDSLEVIDELRISGILEKIGSLWRTPSFNNGRILKLLALASSISGASNNIFDSLTGLLDAVLLNVSSIWMFRLVDTILRRYPKRQYVLSQSRAELSQVSPQIVQISTKALDYIFKDLEYNKTVTGLMKSVLERWEDLTDCPSEIEVGFCERVQCFLDDAYKQPEPECDNFSFNLLAVLVKDFIPCFTPLLVSLFRNALKHSVTDSRRSREYLNLIVAHLVKDGGTDRGFPCLFKEYPSLISDIYTLINEINCIANCSCTCKYLWLLMLAESPRTRKVLIYYVIDPEQVRGVKCDDFWIEFMGRIVEFDSGKWDLSSEFLTRARRMDIDSVTATRSHYFFILLKRIVMINDFQRDPENLKFILKCSKQNYEVFNLILGQKIDILNYLPELVPFGNEEIAKKVFNSVKGQLKGPEELLVNILTFSDSAALAAWNLFIESGNLSYEPDEEVNETDLLPKDYGNYLEKLFSEFVTDTNINLINESDDLIEMYIEYYKYGQIRSMILMQESLLSRHGCSELLMRIPLTILRSSGKGFGSIVLDHLLVNGWTEVDFEFIDSSKVSSLINYYLKRLSIL